VQFPASLFLVSATVTVLVRETPRKHLRAESALMLMQDLRGFSLGSQSARVSRANLP